MTGDEQDGETMHGGEVVDIRDHDDKIDQKVLQARLAGEAIGQIGRRLKLSDRAVIRSLGRSLPELTPELRMRLFQEDLMRLDALMGVWYEKAKGGNAVATKLVVSIMERRSAMVGSDSHTRIELIVPGAKEESNSTVQLLDALNRIAAEKPTGGPLLEHDPDPVS